ncbi:hypothetical protein GGI15_001660 [Coemansia interrupta]|uniref:PSP1 C-terminal domain-containing protein n=1 Tax=Coemansia interrupta TaxID=1126814 RepID=A0A9W8LMQ9_9FUNG|nr:hypothetical protein GGI15_001660 [Coemansia interrupta]
MLDGNIKSTNGIDTARMAHNPSSSVESSPITPDVDSRPAEPAFTDIGRQSTTLDNIGAWSSVRPDPTAAYSASGLHNYSISKDVHDLGISYGSLSLTQSQPQHLHNQYTVSGTTAAAVTAAASNNTSAEMDYTELDEAILRGRSTTLPNIFAAPNPHYRYPNMSGADLSGTAGPISPASTSNFSMLSRHGSMSVVNSGSNRTISPLGLSLNANPIHQTSSLDNHFTSQLDSSNGQSRLDLLSGTPGVPVRRFSEFNAESNPSLALASCSMGPLFGAGNAHSFSSSSSTAFGESNHAGNAPSQSLASQTNGSNGRYGSFGHQLPTMREEDGPGVFSHPAMADSVLMRTMSLSHAPGVASSQLFESHQATSSPLHELRHNGTEATNGASGEDELSTNGSYLPLRVKSLKDLRHPSLDGKNDSVYDPSGVDGHAANALFERSAGFQHSLSFNHLSNMASLHRRHSLASTNPHMPTPANSLGHNAKRVEGSAYQSQADWGYSNTGLPAESGADYLGFHHFAHPGGAPQPQTMAPPSAAASAYDVGAGHLQRQGSMPVLSSAISQQQQQQLAAYHQYSGPIPIGRIASAGPPGASHGHFAAATAGSRLGYYGGHAMASQLQPQLHMQPQILQPIPGPMPVHHPGLQHPQQQQYPSVSQPQQPAHHMRRASHPALPSLGAPPANIPLIAPAPTIINSTHPGSHSMIPNPATTITPNMPFADMGKGLTYLSLPKGTRVFVVQFKGRRCDLYFAPNKDMRPKVIPALAPSAIAMPASSGAAAPAAPSSSSSTDPVPVPTEGVYEPGTYVLVEADRGVDLGVIKEELLNSDAIIAFSSSLMQESGAGGCINGGGNVDVAGSDGRRSTAPVDAGDVSLQHQHQHQQSLQGSTSSADEQPVSASSQPSAKDVYIKRIFRIADQREVADLMNNKVLDEQKALSMCQSKVQLRKLSMCVVDAEFQFDRRKLTFYFTAGRRVDFRELVRELFKHFKTRIWMCQQTN